MAGIDTEKQSLAAGRAAVGLHLTYAVALVKCICEKVVDRFVLVKF